MRHEGTIVRWDEAKRFGFIRSGAIAQDVFLHARDYHAARGEPPLQGLRVTFEDIHVGGRGPRAVAAQPAGAPAPTALPARRKRRAGGPPHSGAWLALPLMAAHAIALAWLVAHGQVPRAVLFLALLLNAGAFFAYWHDKAAAERGRWRTPESTLHLWSLAGGWGGAWFAQQLLRHKSAKASFRATYWATVAIHCGAVSGLWWFSRSP